MISKTTHECAAGLLAEPLGLKRVKGKRDAIEVFALATVPGTDRFTSHSTPLICDVTAE